MSKFSDFYDSYQFIMNHPICKIGHINYAERCLDIDVVKVNPEKDEVDDDMTLNTKVQIWLEFGKIIEDEHFGIMSTHDIDLDCGGDTFEEAIVNLANLVYEKYGGYNDD